MRRRAQDIGREIEEAAEHAVAKVIVAWVRAAQGQSFLQTMMWRCTLRANIFCDFVATNNAITTLLGSVA